MKRHIKHILTAAVALLAVLGCTKNEPNTNGRLITMTAHEAGATKALLDADSFMAAGNQIVVYDYYTAPEGVQNPNPATEYYIPGATAESTGETATGTVWPFINATDPDAAAPRYEWTEAGTHKFFGWMVKDNNEDPAITAEGFFGEGFEFDDEEHILTIPTTTLSQGGAQFDFMYSGVTTREPATQGYDQVALGFKHLFTAFKITAANNSSNKIVLRSVTVSGLKNQRSATINYSNAAPVVEYFNSVSDGTFTFNKEVDGNGCELAPYNQASPVAPEPVSDGYYLMWPHTTADFKGDGTTPEAKITIVYDYIELDNNGEVAMTQTNVSKDVKLEAVGTWLAGSKYDLNLVFMDKEIALHCFVQDWIPMEEEIDFTEQVYASMPLTWDGDTVEEDNTNKGRVLLYSDETITAVCRFKIDTPKGATWTASLISLEGHPDAFAIVEDTKYGPVGLESVIKIKITNIDPISQRQVCKLRITVQTADGRTIVANNLMPEDTDEEITEYTIIQNLING